MLGIVHLWVASYARVALILAIALCMGYPLSRRVVRGPTAPLITLLVGVAAFSVVVCLLGWLRIFRGWTVALVAVGAAAISLRLLIGDLPRWRRQLRAAARPDVATIAGLAVVGLALLAFSVFVLYPSTAFDATSYHLPLARDFVHRHGLVYDPFVRFSFFPQANESMFAVMLLLTSNPVASAALEYSVLAAVVLLLPLWFVGSGRRAGGGLVAGLIVLASPVVIYAGTSAFVDTWTLAFVLAGLLLGLDAAEGRTRARPALVLVGVLIGEAAATKYTGALYGAIAVAAVLAAAPETRAFLRALLGALGGFLVIALPWYLWTVHTTGDPLYPYATGVFGNRGGLWTTAEIKLQAVVGRGGVAPGIGSVVSRDVTYLEGNLSYNTGANRSPVSWWLGAGFLGVLIPSLRRDRTFLAVAAAAAVSVIVSVFLSADPRFFIPAIAPFALCGGLAVDRVIDLVARSSAATLVRSRLAPLWCVGAAVLLLWSSAGYVLEFRSQHGNPPTAAAAVSAYLGSRVDCYAAVSYLNAHAGANYRAWGYACEQARYYAHGRLIGDAFSVGSRGRIFDDGGAVLPTDRTLWDRLARLRVQWVILPVGTVPKPAVLEKHALFRLVTMLGGEDVFRVLGA